MYQQLQKIYGKTHWHNYQHQNTMTIQHEQRDFQQHRPLGIGRYTVDLQTTQSTLHL